MNIGLFNLLYTAQNSCKHVPFYGRSKFHVVQTAAICFPQLVLFSPYFLAHPPFQVAKRVVEEQETLGPCIFKSSTKD